MNPESWYYDHMHRNKYFTHINISGDDYLLPTAQSISDHKRGIRISDTGALIWSLLEPGISLSSLIEDFITKAGISDTYKDDAAADVKLFIDHLTDLGIVCEESNDQVSVSGSRSAGTGVSSTAEESVSPIFQAFDKPALELNIAGINIDLYGNRDYFAPSFESFNRHGDPAPGDPVHDPSAGTSDTGKTDLRIAVLESPSDKPSGITGENSGLIIRNKEMNISENAGEYVISYPGSSQVIETRINKESFDTVLFIKKDREGTDMYDPASFVYQLFHAIRIPFLYVSEQRGMYAIHSVSILYKNKAWLFSASSGTGKSTHAALWTDNTDAVNINGDLNVIGIKDGTPAVFGIPWCGTSGLYDTGAYPLGGVIFLKRSQTDRLEDINGSERVITLTRRSISPVWNSKALHSMISDLLPIADSVFIKRLHCTKEVSAQKLLQSSIDSYLS